MHGERVDIIDGRSNMVDLLVELLGDTVHEIVAIARTRARAVQVLADTATNASVVIIGSELERPDPDGFETVPDAWQFHTKVALDIIRSSLPGDQDKIKRPKVYAISSEPLDDPGVINIGPEGILNVAQRLSADSNA